MIRLILIRVVATLIVAFIALCGWGLVFGGDNKDETMRFGTCIAGVQGTIGFWKNTEFAFYHKSWGPAIFPMSFFVVAYPGGSFGGITGPICPSDDVVAYRCQWHRDHPRTDVDTGKPLPDDTEYEPDPECETKKP